MDYPVTPAVRLLRELGIEFTPHLYAFEEHGGAARAALELGVPIHEVIKTLVMEDEAHRPLLILMHGDREVSAKQLARQLNARRIAPCTPAAALKHTGYQVGGISPLGTRTLLPVYAEATVLDLPLIYLNGGKRGFLVALSPRDLRKGIAITPVSAAIPPP